MKRNSELQKKLIEIGLSYAQGTNNLPEHIIGNNFLLFLSFHLHKQKVLPTCFKNILMGNFKNFNIFLSDFRSDYSVDHNAQGYNQTIAVLQSINLSLKKFYLIPKSTERFTVKLDHIGQDLFMPIFRGYKRIPFVGKPKLNSKYVLKSPETPFSGKILSVTFMEYLSDHAGWFVEGNNNTLLVYRRGKKIKPSGIYEFIEDAVEIARLLLVNTSSHQ